jgi:hypothetical protein
MLEIFLKKGFVGILIIAFLYLSWGSVLADNDTNDSIENAEQIGAGTHTGSVNYSDDTMDFYIIQVRELARLKIEGKIIDPNQGDFISIQSVDGNGVPDYRIDIHVGSDSQRDYCEFKNELESYLGVYILVQGMGDYQMKIDIETSSENDSRSLDEFLAEIRQSVCGGSMIALGAALALSLLIIKSYTKR